MLSLGDYLVKYKARQKNVRISNPKGINHDCWLQLEEFSRLGDVIVDQSSPVTEKLRIGAYSYIRSYSKLLGIAKIGRYCSIGRNVTLGLPPRNHPVDWVSTSTQFSRQYTHQLAPTVIGHDVWVGNNAVVMAGLTIGHGAIIGCDAVVTKDVLPYEIVAGNPARSIRFRFDKAIIEQLLASKWWDYDKHELEKLDFQDIIHFTQNIWKLNQKAQFSLIEIKGKRVSFG